MPGTITPVQRAKIRKKTKYHEPDPSELAGELNIIPFLDIVVNLIIFLLATTASVLMISEIDAQLPTGSRMGKRGAATEDKALNLSVTITGEGVIVAGSGGKLAPGCENTAGGRTLTVPMVQGKYDWPGLTTCVSRIKGAYPDEDQVILQADPVIEYEHVVAAMDAVRNEAGKDGKELFPNLMLSAGVR